MTMADGDKTFQRNTAIDESTNSGFGQQYCFWSASGSDNFFASAKGARFIHTHHHRDIKGGGFNPYRQPNMPRASVSAKSSFAALYQVSLPSTVADEKKLWEHWLLLRKAEVGVATKGL
jgi:hypothetical protein